MRTCFTYPVVYYTTQWEMNTSHFLFLVLLQLSGLVCYYFFSCFFTEPIIPNTHIYSAGSSTRKAYFKGINFFPQPFFKSVLYFLLSKAPEKEVVKWGLLCVGGIKTSKLGQPTVCHNLSNCHLKTLNGPYFKK